MLSHGNCASVGVMCQEIGFVTYEDLSYLYLPLAHVFALTVQLASFDVGTGIVYWGGDTLQIIAELMQISPTYFPSVPRIFEKLYALALSMAESEEQLRGAVEVGSKVRQLRARGEDVPGGAQRRLRPGRGGPVRQGPRAVRRQAREGRLGRRPDLGRDPRVLLRVRRPGARGLGDDRDHRARDRQHARAREARHGRPPAARRRAEDRRRRRDPDQGPERVPRVLAQPRGDPRDVHRRRLDADRRPRLDRRGRLHDDHRPQEGHHHHRRRQEPGAGEPRERPQAVALDLAGGHARRPAPLPGGADHARPRGDRAVGSRARPARGHGLAGQADEIRS